VLAVVHGKAKDPLIIQAKRQEDAEIFTVTLANRDNLPLQLVRKVVDTL
jgi:nucleoside-triphosphatase THEP1